MILWEKTGRAQGETHDHSQAAGRHCNTKLEGRGKSKRPFHTDILTSVNTVYLFAYLIEVFCGTKEYFTYTMDSAHAW